MENFEKWVLVWIFGTIITVMVVGIIFHMQTHHYEKKTIADVWGCGRSTFCAVKYDDGSFGRESSYDAIVGKEVEVLVPNK